LDEVCALCGYHPRKYNGVDNKQAALDVRINKKRGWKNKQTNSIHLRLGHHESVSTFWHLTKTKRVSSEEKLTMEEPYHL
jgi:hypothetical protein